jgi:hypothetical protein
MHDCIKYRLNPDGSVPAFLCLDPNGVGGAFGVASPGTTRHDDTVFVGLANPGATGDFEVVPTQQALQDYLAAVGAGWMVQDDPADPNSAKPFDPVAAAQSVWDRKTALDAVA